MFGVSYPPDVLRWIQITGIRPNSSKLTRAMAGITFHFAQHSTIRFDIGRVIFTSSGMGMYDDHIKFTPGNSPNNDEDADDKGEPQLKRHRGDNDDNKDQTGRERSRWHGRSRHDNSRSRRREDSRTRKSRPIKETSSHHRHQSRHRSTRSISLSISKLKEDFQAVLGKLKKPSLDKTTVRPSQAPGCQMFKFADQLNDIPTSPCRVPATPELLKPCPRTPTFDMPFMPFRIVWVSFV